MFGFLNSKLIILYRTSCNCCRNLTFVGKILYLVSQPLPKAASQSTFNSDLMIQVKKRTKKYKVSFFYFYNLLGIKIKLFAFKSPHHQPKKIKCIS